jgi:multidrug resistance efflux pump
VANVSIGEPLSPAGEAAVRRRQAEAQLADEEAAVEKIAAQIEGMTETLATKRREIKRLRAELEG